MAILESNETESRSGIRKQLDEASQEVILDIVQIALYRYPFQSMIRETVSNSLDANAEKIQARLIKTGKAEVSDFYAEADPNSKIQADSGFNPEYYNLDHLNPENKVSLDFHINPDTLGRDFMHIKDTGVGLGGKRLVKFFTPGSSSKRLNKKALGKYGIGNKSPLASGIDSYYMVTTYNGQRTTFEIRKDKFDIVTPKFNTKGEANPFYTIEGFVDMSDRLVKVYYEPTTDKNSVEVIIPVKKNNTNTVLDAVASQLMYFKEDIILTKHTYSSSIEFESRIESTKTIVPFKAEILYEDDELVIPDGNTYYNRPHFVMNGVSYGLIDWSELELNPRHGNVGLKFDVSELDVTPARESVQYTEKTKAAILKKYDSLLAKIKDRIQTKLKSTKFLEWTRTANSITYRTTETSALTKDDKVLAKMSNLVTTSDIDYEFTSPSGLKLRYSTDLSTYLGKNLDGRRLSFDNYNKKVTGADENNTYAFDLPTYLQFGKSNSEKNVYLGHIHRSGCFLLRVRVPEEMSTELEVYYHNGCNVKGEDVYIDKFKSLLNYKDDAEGLEKRKTAIYNFKKSLNSLRILRESNIDLYRDVVIPDDFTPEVSNQKDDDDAKKTVDLQALRKAQGKILIYTPVAQTTSYTKVGIDLKSVDHNEITFYKREILKSDLPKFKVDDIVTVYGNDDVKSELLKLSRIKTYKHLVKGKPLSTITLNAWSSASSLNTSDFQIIKVAKTLNKSMELIDGLHISEYGYQITNGILKIDKEILDDCTLSLVFDTLLEGEPLIRLKRTAKALSHIDSKYYKLLDISDVELNVYKGYKALTVYKYVQLVISNVLYKIDNPNVTDEELAKKLELDVKKYIGKSDITGIHIEDDNINKITEIYSLAIELSELHRCLDEHIDSLFPDLFPSGRGFMGTSIIDLKNCQKYMRLILESEKVNFTREYSNLIKY